MLSTAQTRMLLCTFSDYFPDLPYHFLIFYQQKQPPWCSVKKTVFKNFAMFIEKQLCRRESYFKKIAGLQCVT